MSDRSAIEPHYRFVRMDLFEANFVWTIRNFSSYQKSGESLESDVFSPPSFEKISWRLVLLPRGSSPESQDYVSLFLRLVSCDKPVVKSYLRVCILDDEGNELRERQFSKPRRFYQGCESGFQKFVRRDYLADSSIGLMDGDTLRIGCRVPSFTGTTDKGRAEAEAGQAASVQQLCDDYRRLLEDASLSDVTIEARGGLKLPAHKCVLAARSPVFAAMFGHDTKERLENRIKIDDVEADVLKAMLEFIYTAGVKDLEPRAGQLIAVADKYALDDLKAMCEKAMAQGLAVDNAAEALYLAELHAADALKEESLGYIKAHLKEVIETPGFKTVAFSMPELMREILEFIALPRVESKEPVPGTDTVFVKDLADYQDTSDTDSDWD